jgi:hypothetical protein
MDVRRLMDAFRMNDKAVTFVAFPYEDLHGAKTRRLANIGTSYAKAKQMDIDTLNRGVEYIPSERYTRGDWDIAVAELKASLIAPDRAKSEGQQNAYIQITECGSLKWHIEKKELYIFATSVRRTVDEEGNYPAVNSAPKTIAKNVIRSKYLKTGKYRTFKLSHLTGNVKIKGEEIEIE